MNFEDLQKTWQDQPAGASVTISTDALLKEVRRNQRQFLATIFWRDVREVGVAAWLTWLFARWGIRDHAWALYLLSFACFGVGMFMLVDRWLQYRTRPVANDSLRSCLEMSLRQVNHQIWLLKNIFWSYLLPPLIGEFALVLSLAWGIHTESLGQRIAVFGFILTISVIVFGGVDWLIYRLNQAAVRKILIPRRQELEDLLASLK